MKYVLTFLCSCSAFSLAITTAFWVTGDESITPLLVFSVISASSIAISDRLDDLREELEFQKCKSNTSLMKVKTLLK